MSKIRSAVLGLLLGAAMANPAAAQDPTKVYPYPGDPSWYPMDRFWDVIEPLDGRAQITGDQPFNGNGSLALSTTGDLWDWGFYATLSGRDPQTGQLLNHWGSLSDLSGLGMHWRREDITPTNPNGFNTWPDAPWMAQTPVLRLLLGDDSGLLMGELVWEKYYSAAGGYTTPYGSWQDENLFDQNFWYAAADAQGVLGGQYFVNGACQSWDTYGQVTPPPVWPGGLLLGTPTGWASGSFASSGATSACATQGFNLANARVYGIAVGVGSNWPDAYEGYVDHVRLSFDTDQGSYDAVYANFELPMTPVPEPGTVALLATGLLGLGGAQLIRRRRAK